VIGGAEAAALTNQHYDLPTDVFATFLDTRMKYSCGLYPTGRETLDEAQTASLAYITRLLHIDGGERVLDIGCGWGSLSVYLAAEHGCRVTAVTPAPAQAEYVRRAATRAGVTGLVDVRLGSVFDVDLGDAWFDAVALVEMVEHIPDHGALLAVAVGHLRRGGRLFLSASCYRSRVEQAEFADRPATRHVAEVFGYGLMRPVSALLAAAEDTGLSISSLIDLTAHYPRTIDEWARRAARHSDRIEALVPGLSAHLARYFETSNAGWGHTTKLYAFSGTRSRIGEAEVLR
jgi:cyclopropane-fatty-acyl-phospholipid synthase